MPQGLGGGHALLWIDNEQLSDKVASSLRDVFPEPLVEIDAPLCRLPDQLILVV